MSDELRSIVPSAAVLGSIGVIALYWTLTRGWAEEARARIRDAVAVAVLVIFFQAVHFSEELYTGFHERFPALFGLPAMPREFFVQLNLAWLAIWGLSAWGLAARVRAALFPLWFLGAACVVNGVAHPGLSILERGYFPGLVTAPILLVFGTLLLRRLRFVTRRSGSSREAS